MDTSILEEQINKAKKAEDENQNFLAFNLYKSALGDALKLSDKASILFCKKKLVETAKKSKSEFKQFTFEQSIPNEEIKKAIDVVLNADTLAGIFEKIAKYTHLFPDKNKVEETAHGTMPISLQICNSSTISNEGHLLSNGENPYYSWYMEMYHINQGFINNMYLNNIFEELSKFKEEEKRFNAESLYNYFEKAAIFPTDKLPLIKMAIDRYFAEDYISALHIFIPQFENLFLHVSEKVGIDVISINRGKGLSTNPRVLSIPLLETEECKKNWKENFCEQLKFILLDPLGYKFRHKVAHGEIDVEECNKTNCNLIIYLYLVILGRIIVKEILQKQEITVLIDKPIGDVFRFTIDPNNTPKWISGIIEEQVDKKPVSVGAIYKNKNIKGEWTEYIVTEFEENKVFALKQKESTYNVRYTYLSLGDNSTKLSYLEWTEIGGIKEPFTKEIMLKLKEVLEKQ